MTTTSTTQTTVLPTGIPFTPIGDIVRDIAYRQPDHLALIDEHETLTYAQLDEMMNRIAAALQRDGVKPGQAVAICGYNSVPYAAVFLGILRAGAVAAPLAPSSTAQALAAMLRDCAAPILFVDKGSEDLVPTGAGAPHCVSLDGQARGHDMEEWMAPEDSKPAPVNITPADAFNIIYSSGTTGTPKGIVQSYGMRWGHMQRNRSGTYSPDAVTLLATPLYSNTTLVVFFPTIANGGCVVLMSKFDALRYLQLAEKHRVTHTMLVPVQYQRLMALPQFGDFDLTSFIAKFCTSAPFGAALKADILKRWPGGLTEFYGMTEGGGSCVLEAHLYPDKLHTVGKPAPTTDIRLIDENGNEVPVGEAGEVVGHSGSMMTNYHNQPGKTREAEWYDSTGKRFIRTGDVGRFDADGFLTLFDRRKDMVISGGFNIYPSDLEAQIRQHPAVADVAVVGVPSQQWGETPIAYVVVRAGDTTSPQEIKDWYNQRAGKTQRVADLLLVEELPRSAIGKVLKRQLRDSYTGKVA